MNPITRFEAASRSTTELYVLHTQAMLAFASAARGSETRRNALAALEAIEAELAARPQGI